jgi:hypothetical protein
MLRLLNASAKPCSTTSNRDSDGWLALLDNPILGNNAPRRIAKLRHGLFDLIAREAHRPRILRSLSETLAQIARSKQDVFGIYRKG